MQKETPLGLATASAHPGEPFCLFSFCFHYLSEGKQISLSVSQNLYAVAALFSPDNKYSKERVTLKMRFVKY